MRATSTNETSLVVAAQGGDQRALDELVMAYLPFVYTIVGRALSGHADADDVVQETMLRALRELRELRTPESFRPWLVAIAVHQVSTHLRRRRTATERTTALDELTEASDPDADFEGLTVLRLELSGQRRQVMRASRWLDPDDRALLSLWWLEIAGQMTRTELATGLGLGVAHAGVRIQRMRYQLELSRSVVAALDASTACARLRSVVSAWDGVPSPLWRKRIARHTRSCAVCTRAAAGMIEPERLLVGFALLSVPMALSAAALGKGALAGTAFGAASGAIVSGTGVAAGSGAVGAGVKAGLLGQIAQAMGAHPVAAAVAAGTLVAGAAVSTATWSTAPPPAPAVIAAPTSAPAVILPPPPAPAAASPAPRRPTPTAARPSSAGSGRLALTLTSLESVNAAGLVVATTDGLGVLERIGADSAEPARRRATFEVVPGLADPSCVSFRAQDGRYMRHLSWRLRLSQDDGRRLFRGDATFCVRAGSVPGSVSLESSNYPGWYVRHRGNELWVDLSDGTAAFRADASFRPRPLGR
jgi:RNA polymerase sigma factor (sigma-70 family)